MCVMTNYSWQLAHQWTSFKLTVSNSYATVREVCTKIAYYKTLFGAEAKPVPPQRSGRHVAI